MARKILTKYPSSYVKATISSEYPNTFGVTTSRDECIQTIIDMLNSNYGDFEAIANFFASTFPDITLQTFLALYKDAKDNLNAEI